jgi:8-oxo-dGTP pyrophosphatase MutT (NUDIX family)
MMGTAPRPRPPQPGGPRLLVVAGLVWLGSRLLVQRRSPAASHGAGLLELPGGKLERGEGPRAALARELVEEWGPAAAGLEVGRVEDVLHPAYPAPGPEGVLIVLHVDAGAWLAGDWRTRVSPEPGVEVLAFERGELPVEQFLAADRDFIRRLANPGT